jgi:hypothetical protein
MIIFLEQLLNKSGFGLAFLFHDEDLARPVAIMVPLAHLSAQAGESVSDRGPHRRPWPPRGSPTMLSVFCSPSRYTQGRNATAALGQEMAALGLRGPALLVAGRSAARLLDATWQRTFHEAGITHAVHPFGGECSLAEIERAKAAAQRHRAGVIVGAGGGKVLDTARAVAADLGLPVVNCPTVASSDAPCSALSVIYTDDGVFHEYRF